MTNVQSGPEFLNFLRTSPWCPYAVVDTRKRCGDWEGDTMEGGKGSGGLATHVERRCRYLIAARLNDKKAATMTQQSIRSGAPMPLSIRESAAVTGKAIRWREGKGQAVLRPMWNADAGI
ncbi:MAG: hypothetical protein PHC90_13960 [Syntrophorhabdaceae bacterium]|nr:hypothetical protein [Syntrophorhabdaceae bacterium]